MNVSKFIKPKEKKKTIQEKVRSPKSLSFISAVTMVLPSLLGTSQKAFAAGHHYIKVDKVPGLVKIDDNSFGPRDGQIASVHCIRGNFWDSRHQAVHGKVEGKDMRFYCLEPEKITPVAGTSSKSKNQVAKAAVKKILMVGFGANSAEEMGFPGYSSEAEYATQVAVWEAQGAIDNVRWMNTASGKKANQIYNYVKKEAAKIKGNGATKLTLKVTDVNKEEGTATITPNLEENSQPISREGKVKMTGMTATQSGSPITNTAISNKPVKIKLIQPSNGPESRGSSSNDNNLPGVTTREGESDNIGGTGGESGGTSGSTTIASGSINFTFEGRTLAAPMYNAQSNNTQDTVCLVSLPARNVSKKWSFNQPERTENDSEQAQFDIVKKDDEGNPVEGAKFDIYTADDGWSQDEFIGTLTTDKNGIARSGLLEFGKYLAIEKSTGKNLEVDSTPVQVDLTKNNLKDNAKVTKEKVDGKEISVYHLTVQGPINNHKPPLMTSLLTNLEDNSKFAQPIKGPVVLNEHLYFSHLVGTVSYNVHAWLVDKATGQPITINGQKIEANKTIGSPNEDGNDDGIEAYTDIQLKIPDASSLAGKDIVAFSEIARSDKPDHYTTVHQDINDKNETIHFSKPEIHTTAVNKETEGKKLQPTDGETITDTVDYKELIPGKEYTLHGIVMDKETGKAVMNNGKNVEFTKRFTATAANGSVKASVTFDDHHYRNHRLVVFESLYYTDYLLTDHRDINDVDQSLDVTNPQLHTTLSDNTEKLVSPKPENTVEDVVRYTDLIPGQTYSIRGKLIDQVTGAPVVKHGVPVMATATFQPTMPNGTVTLTFVFDGTQYTGHHLTAFESLYFNGRIVAEHADLNDASQTVTVDNSHGIAIPVPTIPRPGGTVVNNNNNNNNNSSNNNSSNGNNGNNVSNNNEGNNNTPVVNQPKHDKLAILPTGHQVAQAQTQNPEALPKTAPTGYSLPQTGSARDTLAQNVGGIIVVMTVSSMVYFVKRKQTTGLD